MIGLRKSKPTLDYTPETLITPVATDPETGAVLYGTTPLFLERLGIGTVADLPKLSPHLPGLENLQDFDHTTY